MLLFIPLTGAHAASRNLSLGPEQLAIIINDVDPLSRRIAAYYRKQRNIPKDNLIHVRFKPGNPVMSSESFDAVYRKIVEQTPASVQGYALAWSVPYRVECMSITTAVAAGFDKKFCASGCKATRPSPYYDSDSRRPWDDFGWRPAMMLAGTRFEDVKVLIDRGVAADYTYPHGRAYLLSTSDRARNTRARFYERALSTLKDRFDIEIVKGNRLTSRTDVMFYFTGLPVVFDIRSNRYLPGAIADHLTSSGGVLTGDKQMSSLRWLEAGATGSYGTVAEPCSFTEKFPRPDIVMQHYLDGDTLLEAYWKSVAWPGQGVFIGEPLAAPFAGVPGRDNE